MSDTVEQRCMRDAHLPLAMRGWLLALALLLWAEPARPAVPLPPPAAVPAWQGVLFRVTPPAPPGPTCVECPTRASSPLAWLPSSADNALPAWVQQSASGAGPCHPSRPGSLILGTIHFGTRFEQGLQSVDVDALLAGSCVLVVEARAPEVWSAEFDAYRLLPEGVALSTLLSSEGMAKARTLLPDLTPAQLERLKPWAVLALLEERGGVPGAEPLDAVILEGALARSMPVLALETLPEQLAALDCVDPVTHAFVLEERLQAPWILMDMSTRALTHYRQRDLAAWLGDIDRMPGLGEQGRRIEQGARDCLIEQRNARWMPRLLELLADDGHLVAVGALHLVGEHGLLAGLSQAGFRVEVEPL